MKIDIQEIEQILHKSLNDAPKVKEILKEIETVAEELKAEQKETKGPKAKNQFVIISFNPDNESGIIVQIPESDDSGTVLARISEAAKLFNETKKGKKFPISTIGDAASLKRKWTKQANIQVKTPISVRILKSDNKLV